MLIGGDYQNQSQCMVGPLAREGVSHFFVDSLFVGCDGFVSGVGFTGRDHLRAEVVREMARQAVRCLVLTDSSKFSQRGSVALLPLSAVAAVHTDDGLPEQVASELAEAGIAVHTVPHRRAQTAPPHSS